MASRRRSLRYFAAVAATAAVALGIPMAIDAPARAATAPFTVTVTPHELLGDGQLVTVTIKTSADYPLAAALLRVCRAGVTYKSASGSRPDDDFEIGGANCPDKGVTTSADRGLTDANVFENAATPAGSVTKYRVGAGQIGWTNVFDKSSETLTCGPKDPCALVVEARGANDGKWTPVVTTLDFKVDDPIEGCGGPADDILLSGGSDRMSDAWVSWTLDECSLPGRKGATSRAVFTGEGPAVNSFAKGSLDFAYTAAAYGDEVGLLDLPDGTEPRKAVAIPVAVNATVLAVFGGHRGPTGVKLPYDDVRLTLPEVAGLLSAGSQGIQPHFADVFDRNPELDGNFFETGNRAGFNVSAPAEAESPSWFFTKHLLANVPGDWKVPDLAMFQGDAGRARGADAALALADPTYALSLTLLTGRPPLAKSVAQVLQSQDTVGGAWVLTDLETANALGMSIVRIANSKGEFVPVTDASVEAGVASMHATDGGMLLPDPGASTKVDGVTPYPLAFVEYVLAPAEPLVDVDCTARTGSQELLHSWLEYLTGPGQQKLPAGMLPLPADLKAQAAQRIAQVGAAPVTGDCDGVTVVPITTTTSSTTSTTAAASTTGGSDGTGGGAANLGGSTGRSSNRGSGSRSSNTTVPLVVPDPGNGTTEDTVELSQVPSFAGRNAPGWTGTLLALLGLTGLSGLAAFGASQRRKSVTGEGT